MNKRTPSLAKGVRLRISAEGAAMLLVPEGVLMLNEPAAAALALVDGKRSVDEIYDALGEQFDVSREQAETDVAQLFERLAERRFVIL